MPPRAMALALQKLEHVLVRNHDEKTKDMSRSVLPSKGRELARGSRREIHKRQRARELSGLAGYRRTADRAGIGPDFHGSYRGEIAEMVSVRRFADKDAPLVRWAQATIEADPMLRKAPRAEQLAYFARLMPPNLIGRHAVRHIQWALEARDLRDVRERDSRTASTRPRRADRVAETERLLREILAAGLHGTLNAGLRQAAAREPETSHLALPHRLLLGSHDIEAFATELANVPKAQQVIEAVAALTR